MHQIHLPLTACKATTPTYATLLQDTVLDALFSILSPFSIYILWLIELIKMCTMCINYFRHASMIRSANYFAVQNYIVYENMMWQNEMKLRTNPFRQLMHYIFMIIITSNASASRRTIKCSSNECEWYGANQISNLSFRMCLEVPFYETEICVRWVDKMRKLIQNISSVLNGVLVRSKCTFIKKYEPKRLSQKVKRA